MVAGVRADRFPLRGNLQASNNRLVPLLHPPLQPEKSAIFVAERKMGQRQPPARDRLRGEAPLDLGKELLRGYPIPGIREQKLGVSSRPFNACSMAPS